jgi:alpha-galactosidase
MKTVRNGGLWCAVWAAVLVAKAWADAGPQPNSRIAEMAAAATWFGALQSAQPATTPAPATIASTARLPFSFVYGGRSSRELLAGWKRTTSSRALSSGRTESTTTLVDPATDLEVRVVATSLADFPAVEWVLHLKNNGKGDSPILQKVLPLDAAWRISAAGAPPVLHHARGALCCLDDYAPLEKALAPGVAVELQPGGGRSSSEHLPFVNLDLGGEGVVFGIGWSGQWKSAFRREADGTLAAEAGMATTRLTLRPGESIRTPRILALFWQGDRLRGNNLLRRLLLAHHRPTPGGKPLVLPVLIGAWGGSPAVEHLKTIRRIIDRSLPIELYWIDAEWFGKGPWYINPGNWEVRKDLYPDGLKALSEPLHRSGRKFLLWFEPQRVCVGTPWAKLAEKPGWLLPLGRGVPEYRQRNMNWGVPHEDPRWIVWESRRSQIVDGDRLWNMGSPEARRFLTDWLIGRIDEFGLDWYREDFNIAPFEYWQNADPPDRQGITEIRFVDGLYAMWDELLQRRPHLAIDNCASGGRRIDLETIGRATALWRTDWPADALHRQCHTFGLMQWVPLHMSDGAVLEPGTEYEIRSAMTAGLNVKLPAKDDEASNREAKRRIEQYLSIRRFYYGDFYPLTAYSKTQDSWMAYQLHLAESDEGLIVALRRPAAPDAKRPLVLFGLTPEATYELTNVDTAATWRALGSELMQRGFAVELPRKPDSALVRFRRAPSANVPAPSQ